MHAIQENGAGPFIVNNNACGTAEKKNEMNLLSLVRCSKRLVQK